MINYFKSHYNHILFVSDGQTDIFLTSPQSDNLRRH